MDDFMSPLALRHVIKLLHAGRLQAGASFANQLSLSYATKSFLFSFPTDIVCKFSKVFMGLREKTVTLYSG